MQGYSFSNVGGLIGFAEDDYRRMQRQQLLTQLPPSYSSLNGLNGFIVKDISFKGKLEQEIKDWCGGILDR